MMRLFWTAILTLALMASCAPPPMAELTPTAAPSSTQPPPPTVTPTSPPTPTPKPEPALYVLSKSGNVTRVSLAGEKETIIQGVGGYGLQVANDSIYLTDSTRSHILIYALDGTLLRTVKLFPDARFINFTCLPDGAFALLNNVSDQVYFTDPEGALVATVAMLKQRDDQAQNVSAIVANGSLVLSEDGRKHVLTIDLGTHEASTFADLRSLPGAWLGEIAFADGIYYLATSKTIYTISQDGPAKQITTLPKGNITGLVIVGNVAYASVNFTGEIYQVNLNDGTSSVLASGLDYPNGLGFVPD